MSFVSARRPRTVIPSPSAAATGKPRTGGCCRHETQELDGLEVPVTEGIW